MLSAPSAYKQSMDQNYRKQSYMVATIGIINQAAQKNAAFIEENGAKYSYLSNLSRPLDNYDVKWNYVTLEQDWYKLDGTMLFTPRPESADYLINNGAIYKDILGPICIQTTDA